MAAAPTGVDDVLNADTKALLSRTNKKAEVVDPHQERADDMMRRLVAILKHKKIRASDLFKKIDDSGDGSVDGQELKSAFADLGMKCTDEEFELVMRRIDKDGGGDVSLKEFERALKAAEKLPPKKKDGEAGGASKQKRQGLSADDKEEFRQIFCLFKQLCRARREDDGSGTQQVDLVAWDDGGSISVDELEQLLETVGVRLDSAELDAMVKEIDLDGNGEIDFEEFCQTMQRKIQVDYAPEEIAKSFKAFAKNAPEGMIRVKDLGDALKTYMHKDLIDAEVDQLILHYRDCFVRVPGSDHDYFNYQDYIDLMSPIVERSGGNE